MYSSAITSPGAFGTTRCSDEPSGLSIAALAGLSRWSPERVFAMPGRCRGSVLARWGDVCRRRLGASAVRRVREAVGELAEELPDEPPEHAWFPVALQIRITDLVIDEYLDGDPLALDPLLRDDIGRSLGRVTRTFLRTVGPGPVLGRAKVLHAHLYDVGDASAKTRSGSATIQSEGAELFANPTWQILQLMAHRGLVDLTGRKLRSLTASMPASNAFRVDVHWD